MDIQRLIRHLAYLPWLTRRILNANDLRELGQAVQASEARHRGELRFVVEGALDAGQLWRGLTARDRALELFSELRVWDTEENSGVLIYLLLADRRVEIIADRGIHQKTGAEHWATLCRAMEEFFRRGHFKEGLLEGLRGVSAQLERDYPARDRNPDELPNTPVILS